MTQPETHVPLSFDTHEAPEERHFFAKGLNTSLKRELRSWIALPPNTFCVMISCYTGAYNKLSGSAPLPLADPVPYGTYKILVCVPVQS